MLPFKREILFTFPQTTAAIAAEKALLSAGIAVRVMPLPGAIAAGCGICLRVSPGERIFAQAALDARAIPIDGLYLQMDGSIQPLPLAERVFSQAMGIGPGDVVSLVGCGGKTSLMYQLCQENKRGKALLSTTTRILLPPPFLYSREIQPCMPLEAGISLLHGGTTETGKLLSPPLDALRACAAPDTLLVLEADGSMGLPLKGWAEREPVVPDFTTVTIGVVTTAPAGDTASAANTHRPERFAALTGVDIGGTVTIEALAAMIEAPGGMLEKAVGRRILFINQAETEDTQARARALVDALSPQCKGRLDRVLCGSLHESTCSILWQGGI